MQNFHKAPKRLYAHRGASFLFPENTLDAFRQGLQDGANALELDVRLTADEVVVVFHDPDGIRMAKNNNLINQVSYEQILNWDLSLGFRAQYPSRNLARRPFRVTRFEEVLAAFPNIPLNVDIKASGLRAAVAAVDLIRRHNAQQRVTLASINWQTLRYVHDLGYEGPTGFDRFNILRLYYLPVSTLKNLNLRNQAVQVPLRAAGIMRFDTREFISKCHALNLRVDFWTINNRQAARALLDLGADGIMSDDPAAIEPIFSDYT